LKRVNVTGSFGAIYKTIDLDYRMDVLRLDLLHPEVSGNKWFKLKFNLREALQQGKTSLLTFGGAYSNHIAATAVAASQLGLKSIGVIRGENQSANNSTLSKAAKQGMQLYFVDREDYKNKNSAAFIHTLKEKFGDFYLVPEGGNNKLGLLGCKTIAEPFREYDYIFCACGTGATFAGLLLGKQSHQVLVGINVLKGENQLVHDVSQMLLKSGLNEGIELMGNEALESSQIEHSCITDRYAFSGYAGFDKLLIEFKADFEKEFKLPLDHVYTTKLFYAAFDLLKNKKLRKGASVLLVHSGGLQGNEGFEKRYHHKLRR
jgi:1-aminocyclopropane-1-carboxylate deaminase